jgi:hypothetical protein
MLIGGAVLLCAIVAPLAWALAAARRPFEYMVVGCFLTALGLATGFVACVVRNPWRLRARD